MKKESKSEHNQYNSEEDISDLSGGSYGHELADAILFNREIEVLAKESELEKMTKFIRKSDNMGLNPDKRFDNRYEKQILLREYGYHISEKDSDFKVGCIFNKLYVSLQKKINKPESR
jgi:hypothetical protein